MVERSPGLKKVLRRIESESIIAGRRLTVLSDDTFIVSYPRSGNTWARFLIANFFYDEVSFANIDDILTIKLIIISLNKYIT